MYEKLSAVNSRVLLFAKLWQDKVYGIDTAAKAAWFADRSEFLINAGRIILLSEDEALLEAVLTGRTSITAAAAACRYDPVPLVRVLVNGKTVFRPAKPRDDNEVFVADEPEEIHATH